MPNTLKLTPGLADAIVGAVRRGVPASTAARAAGISDATVLDWLQAPVVGKWRSGADVDEASLQALLEFKERVTQAQAQFEQESIEAIAQAGRVVGKSGVPEWRATAWIANNHPAYRHTYKQERSLSVDNVQAIQHQHTHTLVRMMDDTSLANALKAAPEGTD